ncbi:putative bifunctional diguanylate cyclase/phosphodiesterase [Catenuloplanes japonicus]|uniref:putative bifunctional diguanylate cyclase/phosphodiesterase n=1 Tax=Catenuloplanes japonicus TaxID=33876 RepID=UPI0005266760|nr:bifunctional diguanylate cyclase/phosphodiesterase [Catenuloplanes japonicus]
MTRAQRTVAVAALVVLAAGLAAGLLPAAGSNLGQGLSSLLTLAAAWTAAVLGLRAAMRTSNLRNRVAWRLQCAAYLAWSFGPVSWAWYYLVADGSPQPSPGLIVIRLAFFVLMLAAIWAMSRAAGNRARLRMILDAVVAAAAVFIVAWGGIFGEIWERAGAGRAGVAFGLTYALSDMILLIFLAVLVATEIPSGHRRGPLLVMATLATITIADVTFTHRVMYEGRPFDAINPGMWTLAFAFSAVAALGYRGTSPRRETATTSRFAVYGPYLPIVPAAVTLAARIATGSMPRAAEVVGLVVLFTAVLIRQVLVLGENLALLRRLEVSERGLQHKATHDALTGLGNRAMLTARLHELLPAPPRRLSLLFLDLDDFKEVNDSLGHPAGDVVLTTVAARLTTVLRQDDTVVRLGGDEFAVLLDDFDGDPRALARRMLDMFQEPFEIGGRHIALGCSVGLVEVEAGDARTAMELLRDADIAMYAVKRGGKNNVQLFNPDLHHTTSEELELRADLVRALDDGQLHAAYQPICDAATGEIRGFEALARWTHPTLGPIRPDRFIAIAERAHLSRRVTAAMLDSALADLGGWIDAGAPGHLKVSVNVSAAEISDPALPVRLRDALARRRLHGHNLVVEITETALMEHSECVVTAIRRIQALGIGLAIDDFGTGYSSLARLNRFNVESLKIDKQFVDDLGTPRGRDMIAALVALARSCGMATIAEGVEETSQRETLRDLGCDQIQGYLFSRPVPAADVPALLGTKVA